MRKEVEIGKPEERLEEVLSLYIYIYFIIIDNMKSSEN